MDAHCKLFVGDLSQETTEGSLRAHFERFGELVEAMVILDPVTRGSRGFGYITFADINNAMVCMKDTHTVDGKEVELKKAVFKGESTPVKINKVLLRGLAPETSEADIKESLCTVVPENEVEYVQIETEKGSGSPRGYGYAFFSTCAAADLICSKKYIKMRGRDVEVRKADKRQTYGGGGSRGMGGGRMGPGDDDGRGGGRDPYGRPNYAGEHNVAGYGGVGAPGGYDYGAASTSDKERERQGSGRGTAGYRPYQY